MKRWSTVVDFIVSGKTPTSETVASFEGWSAKGDGGESLWVKTGNTATASQSPMDRGDNRLTDKQGVEYAPTKGTVFYFDGANQWFPSPFGDSGFGLYQFNGADWDFYEIGNQPEESTTTDGLINGLRAYNEGDVITTTGFSVAGDGGAGSWVATSTTGLTPSQTPADRGAAELVDATGRLWRYAGESVNPIQVGAKADGSDDTAFIQLCFNSGLSVKPYGGKVYKCSDLIAINNMDIDLTGDTLDARSIDFTGVSGAKIKGASFIYSGVDASYLWMDLDGSSDCEFDKCVFTGLPSSALASIHLSSGAFNNKFERCEFYDCETSAIAIDGSSDGVKPKSNKVIGCRFEGGAFGVRMNNCSDNTLSGNYTIGGTGIELIGLQFAANYNVISDNIAQLTGDNGISISGSYNTVTGNICKTNDRAGIWIWGAFNTVTGNVCTNNTQAGGLWAGIGVSANFGGTGQFNVITGNTLDDTQPAPTQPNSLRFSGSAYTDWAQGQSIDTSSGNVYRVSGLNLYIATNSGTTGATAPTHTSGTVTDGGISWRYVNTFVNEADSSFNRAHPNSIGRSSSNAVVDATLKNKYNSQNESVLDKTLKINTDSNTAFISADGLASDIDLKLNVKGGGKLSFGTHESLSGQSVTGFIRIKDASGVQRLLAVVS